MTGRRRRILFVSEAVTLAQIVRLVVLARGLPRDRWDVHFASAAFDDLIFAGTSFTRWPIFSLSPAVIDRRVRGGRRLYGLRVLRRYLADDRRVLAAVRPDVVVGDLRLSLAVAAPLAGVPHAALVNAYWSPHAARDGFPLPDHPIVRLLGPTLAARHFPRALPFVFQHFAAPVNRLRAEHGLPALGSLPDVLTHGDVTLFPDPAALVPTPGAPPHHHHLGPVSWSPDAPADLAGWHRGARGRPTVYVTLGSSGRAELLPAVVSAVTALGARLLVATAGRVSLSAPPPGALVAPYLPGQRAAAHADLVVCNGGASTAYQALAAGKPVVGIASNLDQYLAMDAITRAGAGVLVRSGSANVQVVKQAVARALEDRALRAAAAALAPVFAAADPAGRFAQVLDELPALTSAR
jgi:UDP:flavonoid glycosyltransferase YjiC (YdhE family)